MTKIKISKKNRKNKYYPKNAYTYLYILPSYTLMIVSDIKSNVQMEINKYILSSNNE